ncbi:NUDIX domain-containing protein [Pseudonocardia sp. NPDC046786]|uniref:NUDIX domain-containing protein n=1 Tax=Pseudonocardia sp. NPDC046786 TaxID=3155471 RepID=UPI0033F96D6B
MAAGFAEDGYVAERTSMPPPSTFSVSIKGVVLDSRQRVLLVKNERDEWELPGGRIEIGESPEECVAREIAEETCWRVTNTRRSASSHGPRSTA